MASPSLPRGSTISAKASDQATPHPRQALETYQQYKDPAKSQSRPSPEQSVILTCPADGPNFPPRLALALPHYVRSVQPTPAAVVVRFKGTGNAPIMKQNLYKISASHKFQAVIAFLRTQLNFKPSDPLFLYINSSFAPAPDDLVSSLFACFGTDNQLIVNYSSTQAWG
ncbi:hypothetical protein JCM10212_005753 [Sporobolomyces blumeae]